MLWRHELWNNLEVVFEKGNVEKAAVFYHNSSVSYWKRETILHRKCWLKIRYSYRTRNLLQEWQILSSLLPNATTCWLNQSLAKIKFFWCHRRFNWFCLVLDRRFQKCGPFVFISCMSYDGQSVGGYCSSSQMLQKHKPWIYIFVCVNNP